MPSSAEAPVLDALLGEAFNPNQPRGPGGEWIKWIRGATPRSLESKDGHYRIKGYSRGGTGFGGAEKGHILRFDPEPDAKVTGKGSKPPEEKLGDFASQDEAKRAAEAHAREAGIEPEAVRTLREKRDKLAERADRAAAKVWGEGKPPAHAQRLANDLEKVEGDYERAAYAAGLEPKRR